MRVIKQVQFEKIGEVYNERAVFYEARLAGRIGDNERDLRYFSPAIEGDSLREEQLERLYGLLLEVQEAVQRDLAHFRVRANANAPAVSEERMAWVIVEVREQMAADVAAALALVDDALGLVADEDEETDEILRLGREDPLTKEGRERLADKIIDRMPEGERNRVAAALVGYVEGGA